MGTPAVRFDSPTEHGPVLERVRVLMVDDRPDNLFATRAVLEDLGEDLVATTSPIEAVDYLLRQDFGLILLDVMMPGMDGFDLALQIRRLRRSRDTPIIFLTAAGSPEGISKGYELGAVDYLLKPVAPELLRAKVAVFIRMARQADKVKYYTDMLEERNGELREAMAVQRQAEQEILRLNRALKTRVGALSELNAELEAFSFTVSHDLNGPLAHITSFSRALKDECGLVLGERGLGYLDRIDSASQRMGQLICDLLELARGSHCDIKLETVDLSAIAGEIAGGLRAAAPERAVQWEIAKGVAARGDLRLLTVALRNLLENAFKFTRRAEAARIEFGVETTTGPPVYFVRDNGIGFKTGDRDKLFQPFQRLPSARDFEGTGVGLATVNRIVKRHGGRIWAEGEEGSGATFYFELPGVNGG
jgi:two-component system, sensor histidine kinase and response regulator